MECTGKLLAEVGVDNLSTNMICERAGLTPPAIYRYFPNKYAILYELSRRLMAEEDAVVLDWLSKNTAPIDHEFEAAVSSRATLLKKVREVVHARPGGVWILRALHAIPSMHEVRLTSVIAVARQVFKAMRKQYPHLNKKRLRTATILTTWLGSAANEIILDNPGLEKEMTKEVARMFSLYYLDLIKSGEDREQC